MVFTVEDVGYHNPSVKLQYMESLRKSAEQTKCAIIKKLKQSEQKFNKEIENCNEKATKKALMNKVNKITKDIKILEMLPENDIVQFALTTQHKVMAVAVNPKVPHIIRLKARVASHKPLSTHLQRVKTKLNESKESEEEKQETSLTPARPLDDKISLNNYIIKMRKDVKRAKVHIIHKYTRDIRKLRNSKNKEKYERKANRLVDKIKCIKELYEDEISKYALTCKNDLEKTSTDVKESLKNQAMATVAVHKFVRDSVTSFKNTYPKLVDNTHKILMLKKKKRRKMSIELSEDKIHAKSEISSSINKRDSDSLMSNSDSEEYSEEEVIESVNENEKLKKKKRPKMSIELSEDKIHTKSKISSSMNKRGSDSLMSNSDSEEYSEEEINENEKSENEADFNSSEDDLEDSKHNSIQNKESGGKDTKLKCLNKNLTSIKHTKISKVVDPFFLTSTSEEYVTSQVPTNENNDRDWKGNRYTDSIEFTKSHKNNRNWGAKEAETKFYKNYEKPVLNRFHKNVDVRNPMEKHTFGIINRKEKRKALHQTTQEEKLEKLHPSWEAKKKMSSIACFQGKKITFE